MQDILLILAIQLVYVPLMTLRTIFLVKNMRLLASIFGFLEVLINVFALSIIFSGEQNFIAMLVYALGFGLGIPLGTMIENKLAVGYVYVTINTQQKNQQLIDMLRNNGFAITTYIGEGRDSDRYKYEILARRNRERELFNLVESIEPKAFIISYEPKSFKGGFLVDRMRKFKIRQEK
ncbi:DUF2179 domain-containing protein [Lysinibacillus yapensis]|uniref:UPF0316 protein D1B33_16250 n=1 Tax=Ureibacillus yapensis TaxID=2304605 RepID=A0A396SIG6_9BACL|nr:DUF2179 domain-containing protein [Lysinibacillus yapensis]RHW32721.1 DUF2179 domain-containing protein [Lysinibacillus yapensis]